MSSIDIFTRIELPQEEVFKYLLNSHTLSRCASPLFKLENLSCSNSKIDLETCFSQKCVLLDILQLFYRTKEIIPNEKILFHFDGLIKGSQCINLIKDENSCILKESIEFSLYNQFSLPILDLLLSLLFYFDTFTKHLRLKNIIYKENPTNKENISKKLTTIRSYITVNANISEIISLFEDLNKFALWVSPLVKIKTLNNSREDKEEREFSMEFLLPLLPSFSCGITKKDLSKIIISFSSSILKGKNTWAILPLGKQYLIENTIEIDEALDYIKLIWMIIGNTFIKGELNNWNKRLKEVAEKTNLSRFLDLAVQGI